VIISRGGIGSSQSESNELPARYNKQKISLLEYIAKMQNYANVIGSYINWLSRFVENLQSSLDATLIDGTPYAVRVARTV